MAKKQINLLSPGYITVFLLGLICSVDCKAQPKTGSYRIEYSRCNPVEFKRKWLNDSIFIDQGVGDNSKDTFLVSGTELYYKRKGEQYGYLSVSSFSRGDTIILYGTDHIRGTHLLPVAEKYIPVRKETIFGKVVLVYKVADRYGHPAVSFDEIFFDPESLMIIKYRTLECGEGTVKEIQ